jgi:hypothetical protein
MNSGGQIHLAFALGADEIIELLHAVYTNEGPKQKK